MTQSTDAPQSAYLRRQVVAQASGFEPYQPSRFRTEHCLITRACQPPKIYQPATDLLPRTMAWLAAKVPMDFIDRVDARMAEAEQAEAFYRSVHTLEQDAALEAANLGEHGFAQVPDPGE